MYDRALTYLYSFNLFLKLSEIIPASPSKYNVWIIKPALIGLVSNLLVALRLGYDQAHQSPHKRGIWIPKQKKLFFLKNEMLSIQYFSIFQLSRSIVDNDYSNWIQVSLWICAQNFDGKFPSRHFEPYKNLIQNFNFAYWVITDPNLIISFCKLNCRFLMPYVTILTMESRLEFTIKPKKRAYEVAWSLLLKTWGRFNKVS